MRRLLALRSVPWVVLSSALVVGGCGEDTDDGGSGAGGSSGSAGTGGTAGGAGTGGTGGAGGSAGSAGTTAAGGAAGTGGGAGSGGTGGSAGSGGTAGAGGSGGTGGSAGSGGTAGAGGSGGALVCTPGADQVVWTYDTTAHTNTQPATFSVQRIASIFQLSVGAIDSVNSASLNLVVTISAPSSVSSIPAGDYPCAPSLTLPNANLSMAEGAANVSSSMAGSTCLVTLTADAVPAGRVVGTLVASLSDGTANHAVVACFDLDP